MNRTQCLYMGTNTKMFKTIAQTKDYVKAICSLTADIERNNFRLFVIPSFTTLEAANKVSDPELLLLGAQNMGWEEMGPFTGEISPLMLKEVGVKIVEIGHSERRHVFMETDDMENKRLLCAINQGFFPLLCVGETQAEKSHGISKEIIKMQLKLDTFGINSDDAAEKLMVAYEPVWAIGEGGVPASGDYVEEIHCCIRETLAELFGSKAAENIPILYGGSVNKKNACDYINKNNVNGLFIGRSAWEADSFNEIIRDVIKKRSEMK